LAGFLDALRAFLTPAPGFTPTVEDVPYGNVWMVDESRVLTAQEWAAGADSSDGNSASGETVDAESAMRTIAFQAAVRLLVNDVRSLPVDFYRGSGQTRTPIGDPAWKVNPNPLNPNYTWSDYVGQIVYSMITEGEAFARCFPSTRSTEGLGVIPASSIKDVEADAGLGVIYRTEKSALTPNELLHIPWILPPGKMRGLNPIAAAAEGLGIALASDRFVGRYFGEGAVLSGVIEFPPGSDPTPQQVDDLKKDFRRKHAGARRSHAVGALTGGAKYVPFDYNNRDAQLLELRESVIEDVARLLGIPPHMLGSQKPGAVGYASVEQRSIDYVTHAILPIVSRIEVAHNRILRGSETYMKFNVKGLLRGDEAARAQFYDRLLQNKVMRREEVRALEDLPYDPESVGYLETPNNNAPDNTPGAA
jgi:HK97 family phage portal protein